MARLAKLSRVREALRREGEPSLPGPEFHRHTPEERRALVASLFVEPGRPAGKATD
jgi:hypothetical protein